MHQAIPPPPTPQLEPLTHAQRVRLFGRFRWEPTPTRNYPGRICVDAGWLTRNTIVLHLPHIAHCNQGSPVRVRVHRLVAIHLLTVMTAWRNAGLIAHVQSWDGCLAERFKLNHSGGVEADLSSHAWGIAFDVNVRWNRAGQRPAPLGKTGCVWPLVELAAEHGFAWGGTFRHPDGTPHPDGGHFECVRV